MSSQPQTERRTSTDGPPVSWSLQDLMAWTGMSHDFFMDEMAAGELHATRFGRVYRVHITEVTRYLANKGYAVPEIG